MKVEKICLTCKALFEVRLFEVKRGCGKYCSKKCFYNRTRRETKRECLICRKKFMTKDSELKRKNRGKYCSRKCTSLANRQFRHSDETKMKIRRSKKGKRRSPFSEKWKENISIASKGRKFHAINTIKKD